MWISISSVQILKTHKIHHEFLSFIQEGIQKYPENDWSKYLLNLFLTQKIYKPRCLKLLLYKSQLNPQEK